MENTSTFGRLGKRVVAWIVLIAAALLAVKLVLSLVVGFVMTLVMIAVGVVLIGAVVWALRFL